MTLNNQWLKKPDVKNEVIIKMYQEGLSSEQIGKKLGLAKSSISRRLKRVGVTLRSSKEYTREKRYWLWKGENYLDPVTRKRNQSLHRKWSHAVIERDGHKCTKCGVSHQRLHAHHVIPIKICIDSELEFDIRNGITLCPKCHKAIHKNIMY